MKMAVSGGWGGIRTHETLARLPVFKTGPFNHSGTSPLVIFVGDTGVFVVGEKFKKLVAEIDAYTHYFKSALRVYYNYLL